MDWARAIERNHQALTAIVAALFAMLGLSGTATVERIPLRLHLAVLRVLRPAEAAVRRLVIIAARGLVVKLPPKRPPPLGAIAGKGSRRRLSFRLFDPRKRFALHREGTASPMVPRLHFFTGDPRLLSLWSHSKPQALAAPPSESQVDAARVCRRLLALKSALEDLPRQARRLARWRIKRENMPSPKFVSPLRPGRPPGHRRRPVHDVDHVLIECHGLAHDALRPDTS